MNLKTKQLANGRWVITASDYNYNKLTNQQRLQILWRSFETEQQAVDFINSL